MTSTAEQRDSTLLYHTKGDKLGIFTLQSLWGSTSYALVSIKLLHCYFTGTESSRTLKTDILSLSTQASLKSTTDVAELSC